MSEDKFDQGESFEERLEKELYGQIKSERLGKVKKIWGKKIKESKSTEDWQDYLDNSNVFGFFNFNLKKIFIISFLLFIISLGIFSIIFYYRTINLKGIDINVIGPEDVNSFQVYEYTINVSNNSKLDIENVRLSINLSEGIYFYDDLDQNSLTYNLDKISSKSSEELKIKLFFLGNIGKGLNFNVNIYYKPSGKNQEFNISKNFLTTVKKEAFSLQIFSPNKIFLNEPFVISLKFTNSSDITYNLNLFLENNPDLEILSINPAPEVGLTTWNFNELKPNDSGEINITAKFTNLVEKPVISFQPKIIYKNKVFFIKNYNLTLNILETPIRLEIVSDPSDYIVNLNKFITYEIKWENKSKVSLQNIKVKVYLTGAFDFESIDTDGYYSPIEKSIIWNSVNKPQLASINPGNKDSIKFSIKTIDKYPPGSKDLNLRVEAILETETIPPEIQILTKKLSIETQESKVIAGNFKFNVKVLYDNQFNNSGSFPLVNGKKTTLSTYFEICTYGEDFQNFIITGKIPLGISLTGNFDFNFDVNKLQFNSETGDFYYKIDELSAGYCDIYPDYKLAFQIEVLPPLYGNINDFIIIPPLKINAQGKFSQKVFELTTQPINGYKINYQNFR
ncbi:MAG: hypothetical protein KatS3mg094_597 [Candidatus Parcubacteria bacterium]|nr:MAG: hypothetical protein KatS3mg094_597 [Candidatus Parcubacteria bacterium]